MRTLSAAEAAGSAAPLATPGRLKGSQLLVLELVPLEKGSAEDAGELKGDATGSCGGRRQHYQRLQLEVIAVKKSGLGLNCRAMGRLGVKLSMSMYISVWVRSRGLITVRPRGQVMAPRLVRKAMAG